MVDVLKASVPVTRRLLGDTSAPSSNVNQAISTAAQETVEASVQQDKTKAELQLAFAEELNELKEETYDESFSKGYEDGQLAAQEDFNNQKEKWQKIATAKEQELDQKIDALDKLLSNMQSAIDDALTTMEPAAISIAFAGLTQLLGQSENYRERLAQQVHHAIDQFGHDSPTRILLNADDAEMLRTIERLQTWSDRFVQEETLEPGSCIIEAGPRSLEASLMIQLNILRQTLLQLSEAKE
jgi:flagellar biosynthesis/type III secretory pathway protein FliH